MIELNIIFIVTVLILGVSLGLLQHRKTVGPDAPPPAAFANTNFTPTQMYMDNTGGSGIALNDSTKTICVIQSSTLPPRFIHFTDLIAVFMLKNGVIIHKTLRTLPQEYATIAQESQSKLPVTPESSSNPSPNDQTQKIDLCLAMQDQENPNHLVNFLDMDTKEDGILFNKAMVSAKHWYQLLSDLIQQANGVKTSDANVSSFDNEQNAGPSIANELEKLSELLNKKAISQTDFNEAKEKILARG